MDKLINLIYFLIIFGFLFHNHKKTKKMSVQLDNLTKSVNDLIAVDESAIALLGNLKTELDAAIEAQKSGDDGAALQALSDTLNAEKEKIAASIVANTPAA